MRAAGWGIGAGAALFVAGMAISGFVLFQGGLEGARAALPDEKAGLLALSGGLAVLGLIVALVALAFYVLIPAFSGGDAARRDYGSHRVVLACTVLAVALGNVLAALFLAPFAVASYLGGASLGGLVGQTLSPPGIVAAAVAPDLAMLGIVYLRIVRPGAITWERMGLRREALSQRLLLGLLGGFLLFGASAAIQQVLDGFGIHQTQTNLFASIRGTTPLELATVLLAGAVVAPVVEEIFFRGFIFRGYLEQKGTFRAFLFSATLFAAVHLNGPALLPIFAMAVLLSFLYYRSGSIVPGIVAHGVNNAAGFLLIYMGLS